MRFAASGGEALPYDEAAFDTVTTTFTLCTIGPVEAALAEIHRVLRPGGLFLFLEHGLAPDARTARCQRALNPVQWWFAGGCQLVREPAALVEAAGFAIERRRDLRGEGLPATHGWLTMGRARR